MQDFPTYSKTYITHKVSNHWSHESWLKLATKKKIKKWDYSAFPKLGLKIIKWCFDLLWKIKVPFNRIQCQYTHLSFIYTYSLLFIYLQLLLPQGGIVLLKNIMDNHFKKWLFNTFYFIYYINYYFSHIN